MGGMGSGGAGFIAEMRRQARREERRREQKRARRQARMAGIRAEREYGSAEREVMRWPFPCAWACGRCGALTLPAAGRRDPMRTEALSVPPQCPHCHATGQAQVDLASRDMALALVDVESHDRKAHANRHRVIGGPLVQTMLLTALAALAFVGGLPIAGATLAAFGLQRGATTVQRVEAQGEAPTHARRWSHHPKPQAAVTEAEGRIAGRVRLAPLSGRPCVAYDVRVVWHGESAEDLRSQALHEQCTDDLTIGGLDVSKAYLQVGAQRLSTQDVLASPQALEFLASRGLEPTHGPFDYYETIVVEGQPAAVTKDAQGSIGVHA